MSPCQKGVGNSSSSMEVEFRPKVGEGKRSTIAFTDLLTYQNHDTYTLLNHCRDQDTLGKQLLERNTTCMSVAK